MVKWTTPELAPSPNYHTTPTGGRYIYQTAGRFALQEKGGNHLVPGPEYMLDALKLPNQASRVSGQSLQTCVAWRCPDGMQHLFYWPNVAVSSQSLASNGPVVDSRYLNLVFGPTEATHNK
ncbi:hypothetical protein TNCV_3967951 [Trichonephila clavipes]|nr:hypothetical protein TNCV_3967951 [Trichonephila clavipes]